MCHMLSLCGSRLGTCPVVGAGPRPGPTPAPVPWGPGLGWAWPSRVPVPPRHDPMGLAWVGTRDWTQTRQGWVPTSTSPPQTLTLGVRGLGWDWGQLGSGPKTSGGAWLGSTWGRGSGTRTSHLGQIPTQTPPDPWGRCWGFGAGVETRPN